ncbi:MAG TPA: hypothetical protein PKD61_09255, partial [Polyangiaceae bacterium]|nr:hypothetical protein [Polyangiaceae bacterium]
MSRLFVSLLALALAAGCGGGSSSSRAPTLPPANPKALSKMAQGVAAAKETGGRSRAIKLLREAVKMDPNLWEARYD